MASQGPAVKPHTAPKDHNQPVPDPIAHFKAIPWCAKLLEDRAVLDIIVPDRRPLESGESNFVRKTMNSPSTVNACVTFFRMLKHPKSSKPVDASISRSRELLAGGGPDDGEDLKNPFLLFNALVELGVDCQSYAGTMHGGLYGVFMDEVMGTAANFQSPHGAYTVQFTTNMKRPIRTPQVVLIRGRVVKKEGRKLYVRGTIEDEDGNLMAEADGLWLNSDKNVGRSQL
ncbi:HotDog domain-containing protein [Xylariales sp. AK1849]|nr:HotDog domain-containing protein [Xylariales sp. AK1849]